MPRKAISQPLGPIERRFQGESPVGTLLYLYSGQEVRLVLAGIFFVIKQSPVWAMPLITANIIDIVTAGGPNTLSSLWFNAMILAVLLVQNIPTHYLYVRLLSLAARSMETRLRSAIVHQLQHLSIGYFVVAHRLSTIRNAKRIVVMKHGHIMEIGTHEELLIKNGAYARLYARQAY